MKTVPFDKYVMSNWHGCGYLGATFEKLVPENLNDRRVIAAALNGYIAKLNGRHQAAVGTSGIPVDDSLGIPVFMSNLKAHFGCFALDENRFDDIWQEDFSIHGQITTFTNYEEKGFESIYKRTDILSVSYYLVSQKEKFYGTIQEKQASFNLAMCWEMPVNVMNPFLQCCLSDTRPVLALQRSHPNFEHHQKEYDALNVRRLNMQGKGLSSPEEPFSHQEWWDGLPPEEREGWDNLYDRD